MTIDGIKFDSKAEGEFYRHLKRMEDSGEIEGVDCQVTYRLHAGIKYRADFVVYFADDEGQKMRIVDVKGVETAIFKLKRKLFEADIGPLDVVKPTYRHGGIYFDWPNIKKT